MPARPAPPAPTLDESTPDPARGTRSPFLPPRGRHPIGMVRLALRRVAVPRVRIEERRRPERRREQLPLPPGFVDRRRAA